MIGLTIILGWVKESQVDQAGQPGFNQNLSNQAQPSSFIQYVAWFLSFTGATNKFSLMYTIVFIPRKMFSCALESNGWITVHCHECDSGIFIPYTSFFACRAHLCEMHFLFLLFLLCPNFSSILHSSVRKCHSIRVIVASPIWSIFFLLPVSFLDLEEVLIFKFI